MAQDLLRKKIGFYRPHKRVTTDYTKVDQKTGEVVPVPTMTKQEFVAECDINNIIKSYSTSGVIRHISERAAQGQYMDLPDNIDFQDSLHIVQRAQESFATLPSSVRSRFQNDPAEFLAFMADPKNQEEIIKLGLATDLRPPPAPPEPTGKKTGGEGGSPPSEGAKAP